MKLTRKKAIALCIELWTWLAETGEEKREWPGWKEDDKADNECWFCEYVRLQEIRYGNSKSCGYCPLVTSGISPEVGGCYETFYKNWEKAKTPRTRKKYAKLFLKQIKSIK